MKIIIRLIIRIIIKCKGHPTTGHGGPDGE
jgi:hypothetical protein